MSEMQTDYIVATRSIVIEIDDWRYNMLLRMEQQKQAGLMLIVDPDARCWFEVGRMECNKQDRVLPFKM